MDAPDARNAVIEHLKSKCFLGEDHHADPHIFLTNHIRAGGNGTGGTIGPSNAIQKRLEWENLIFFVAKGYYILSIHDSQLHVLKQFLWAGG